MSDTLSIFLKRIPTFGQCSPSNKRLNKLMIVVMEYLDSVLVPIFVCVILPVAIVLIVMNARKHEISRKAEVALKAIEAGAPIDPAFFKSDKKRQGTKQKLIDQLTGACITSLIGAAFTVFYFIEKESFLGFAGGVMLAVGIGLFISFFVGRKMLSKEIEAEEQELKKEEE